MATTPGDGDDAADRGAGGGWWRRRRGAGQDAGDREGREGRRGGEGRRGEGVFPFGTPSFGTLLRGGVPNGEEWGRGPEHKTDREIVFEAVNQSVYAFRYAAPELKADREIVLETVKQNEYALKHATPENKTDREFMLKAMRQRGNSLKYVAPEFVPGPSVFPFVFNFSSFQALCFRGGPGRSVLGS